MLPRVSPLTPVWCNSVALGFKPQKSVSNLGTPGQFSDFNHIEAKVLGSAVRALDLGPTSGKCQCSFRVSPVTPTRCYPVALGLKPRESVSNLGHPGQISYFNRIEAKVLGSGVRALDLGPTSRKRQCAHKSVPFKAC